MPERALFAGHVPWPERWDGWIVLALAFALRLIYLFEIRSADPFYAFTISGFDQHTYQRYAADILAGDPLLREWGLFYYTPIYGYFTALLYRLGGEGNFDLLHVVQLIAACGGVWLFWALARHYLSRGEALVAALLVLACRPWLFYEQLLLMEGLILLLHVAVLYFVRGAETGAPLPRARLALAGAASGLAYLGRGNFLVFLFALPIYIVWRWLRREPEEATDRKRLWARAALASGAYLLGATLVLAPMAVRNYTVARTFQIGTTNGPAMLYLGNAADASGEFQYSPRFNEAHAKYQQEPGIYMRMLIEDIKNEPRGVARVLILKTRYFFNGYDIPDNTSIYLGRAFSSVLRWNPLTMQVLLALGLFGAALSLSRCREESLLWLYAVLFSASIILIVPVGRYKLPISIPLALFGARGLFWIARAATAKQWGRVGAAAVALVALLAAAHPYRSPRIRHTDYWTFASTALDQGKTRSAERIAAWAIEDYPKALFTNLARFRFLVHAERWSEARVLGRRIEQVRESMPPSAYVALARLYVHDGRGEEARALLKALLNSNADYAPAQALLGELDSGR